MSETENYGLHLTDDGSERFIDWRNKLNGTNNSNMIKIDEALNGKASHSTTIQKNLAATAWIGTEVPYLQELVIDGLTPEQNGTISIAPNATLEQREAARNGMFFISNQTNGKLTIGADGVIPEIDIPVIIILLD